VIHENVTWHTKMLQMLFIEYKERWLELVFGGNFCQLHMDVKMLVACASDNEARSLYIMNVMFFIVTSNTLDSNQNIAFMI
jgi:hypothetical protein